MMYRKSTASKPFHTERGMTLIELLVAMALGLFLMAAVVQVFLGSQRSATLLQAQMHMQENARFGFEFLAKNLRMAGYKSDIVNVSLFSTHWRGPEYPADAVFAQEAIVSGESDTGGVAGTADILHIRTQGQDPEILDCSGAIIPDGIWVQQTFRLNDANNWLECLVNGANPVTLVEGIEDIQLLYGVNTDAMNAYQASEYMDAGAVTAANAWKDVVAVKVALLSASDGAPMLNETLGPYTLLDRTTATYTDGKARQVFTQTIRLRNKQLDSRE